MYQKTKMWYIHILMHIRQGHLNLIYYIKLFFYVSIAGDWLTAYLR